MEFIANLFRENNNLLDIFFLVAIMDIVTGWIKASVKKVWLSSLSWNGLWKKISSFVLIILAKILDFIIKENGIQFQFSVYNLFISLLILTEIGSIVENLYESEFVEYLKQILKKAKDTITKDF